MKKTTYIIIYLLGTITSFAQVGINSKSPVGVFYINANGKNDYDDSDDVTMNRFANFGIGINSPQAKLHIEGTSPVLRIDDGTQARGRILTSEADGSTMWADIKGSGGYSFKITQPTTFNHLTLAAIPLQGSSNTITVTSRGNYLITLSWWGSTSGVLFDTASAYLYLTKNGTAVDGIEYYTTAQVNSPFTFTTVLMASNCKRGDKLQILINPVMGGQPWIINAPGMMNPTVSIFMM